MPSTMVALDPGMRGCGVAKFVGGVLAAAAYVRNPLTSGGGAAAASRVARSVSEWVGGPVDLLVVEWPRVYAARIRAGSSKADPNDLLGLAGVDAAVTALVRPTTVEQVAPSDWKGQMPKEAMNARVVGRLHEVERELVEKADVPPSLLHNLLDAVGIGLHRLGRLAPRRVLV